MVKSSVLGYPRMGANRELKKSLEAYWGGKVPVSDVTTTAADLRAAHWKLMKEQGLDIIPSYDFAYWDQVLNHSFLLNVIPSRYQNLPLDPIDVYFAMARGHQKAGVDVPSQEMVKWFDTNYHYMRPEVGEETVFRVNIQPHLPGPVESFEEAKSQGFTTRPVLLSPVTFLYLAKLTPASKLSSPLDLLDKLLPVYVQLLSSLAAAGAESVQLDEPIVVFDLDPKVRDAIRKTYEALAKQVPTIKIILTTYFGDVEQENWKVVQGLPVAGIHVDLVPSRSAPIDPKAYLEQVLSSVKGSDKILSLGLVNGRNVWKTDIASALDLVRIASAALTPDRVIVASSSSLLHIPHSLESETKLDPQIKSWFSFAKEKVTEIAILSQAANGSNDLTVESFIKESSAIVANRKASPITFNPEVRKRAEAVTPADLKRPNAFPERKKLQEARLQLPLFPTTTIGSFPQHKEIRAARAKFAAGKSTQEEYDEFIRSDIRRVIEIQESIGLDVLVHGEPERNDMVQYFGEQMSGFVFTENAWVQSYGSRCVRPPIVVGDVARGPKAMTVKESAYAQSVTKKPVKGMLTGPVTILRWSFPRDDLPQAEQFKQIALAIRDEVADLEAAGISVIQVDEPAIREGLPLRRQDWAPYLESAVNAFRLSTGVAKSETQVHSHFCYSDFNDIFTSLQDLDADVISIEASKSDLKLVQAFQRFGYRAWVGPGVYDIHSPRIPSKEEIVQRLTTVLSVLDKELIWINPDCGLKTRDWKETRPSLENLVAAARELRARYAN